MLNLSELGARAEAYFHQGVSPATKKAYRMGLQKFNSFCTQARRKAIPASENTLLLFSTYLASQNLSSSTIQVYLSAVHNAHVAKGQYKSQLTPRLYQVIKGIQKTQCITKSPKTRKPLTYKILEGVRSVLLKHPCTQDDLMIWAACCIAFFGLLRVSEFTTPTQTHFTPSSHLSLADVALDSRTYPQVVRITLKQSKTDQIRQGTHLYLGRTGHHVCPVEAIIPYLIARGNRPGPLFMLQNGKMLTRSIFSAAIHKVLLEVKLNPQCFNTHSFRIGAATSAKQAGISDAYLKALGRWKSHAYLKYIRLSSQDLANLSRNLIPMPVKAQHVKL